MPLDSRHETEGQTPDHCPFCGGASRAHVSAPDRNRRASTVVFHIRGCQECGLGFVVNAPNDLAAYYNSGYHFRPETVSDLAPQLAAHQYKIDLVQRFKNTGRLLEIGPSAGMFCKLAQTAGFSVSAIEMDAECARFLNEQLDVRTVCSNQPEAVLEGDEQSFDAICLWHVIEHVPKPWAVIEQAARRLKPGGVLVIAAPNPEAWQARLLGSYWPHYDLPRHLFHIPAPWLVKLGQRHGLEPELVTTRDEGSLFFNRFSWAMLLHARSKAPRVRDQLWRAGTALGYLLQPWEGREGKGATYTVVLRKPEA